MTHTCSSIMVTCIDFRLQEFIDHWIAENLEPKDFDRVALAGGVFDFEAISNQIKISKRLHQIKRVILVNHEDCGAYGEAGTYQKHIEDLTKAGEEIKKEFSDVDVQTYYLHLDGTFEKI